MSYAQQRFDDFTTDWLTVTLVGLMAGFQAACLWLAHAVLTADVPQPEQQTDVALGVEILALAAVEIGVLLLAWRAYKRLPERWQERIKTALGVLILGTVYYVGLYLYWVAGLTWLYIGLFPLVYAGLKLISRSEYKWIVFNVLAFALGVGFVSIASFAVAPAVLLVVMLAFTMYDHVAVNLSDIMADLIEMSGSVGIPNFIVIPNGLRLDFDRLTDFLSGVRDEKPEDVALMIGLGDFAFPSMLVVSAFVTLGSIELPVVGAVAGTLVATIVLRDSLERSEDGLPALPWLNTGAIGGFLCGAVVSQQTIFTALGI